MKSIFSLPESEAERLIHEEGDKIRAVVEGYDPASALTILADAYFQCIVVIHRYMGQGEEDMKKSVHQQWEEFSKGIAPKLSS